MAKNERGSMGSKNGLKQVLDRDSWKLEKKGAKEGVVVEPKEEIEIPKALLEMNLESKTIAELKAIKKEIGRYFVLGLTDEQQVALSEMSEEIDMLIAEQRQGPEVTQIKTPAEQVETEIPEREQKITKADRKDVSEIKVEIAKPIGNYSENELKTHLAWLRSQIDSPKINNFPDLKKRLEQRILDVRKEQIKLEEDERLARENKKLHRGAYRKLLEEFTNAGIMLGAHYPQMTLEKLKEGRNILLGYEALYPNNKEVLDYLAKIEDAIKQKEAEQAPTPETWTAEDEQTLNDLLRAIENSKKRIAELDEMREALPKTITLNTEEIEKEIVANLIPLLRKNNATLDGITTVVMGEKLKLEVKLTIKRYGMSFPLVIKATIGNDEGMGVIWLESHSYEGSERVKKEAKEKIDPEIEKLVPTLTKFLEQKYGRKIKTTKIKNNGLEVALDAKG